MENERVWKGSSHTFHDTTDLFFIAYYALSGLGIVSTQCCHMLLQLTCRFWVLISSD